MTAGRRMRVDTTVVETNIHHPTDSTLLGDGVRVLIRTMKKISKIAGAVGAKLRDRSRSVKLRLLEIARAARAKGPINQDKLKQRYRQTVECDQPSGGTGEALLQGDRRRSEAGEDVLQQLALEDLRQELEAMLPRVKQVMKQTRARIFHGNTRSRRQAPQPVRAIDRGHSQRQGRQAERVRQDGEAAGSGEPDRDRLRGL